MLVLWSGYELKGKKIRRNEHKKDPGKNIRGLRVEIDGVEPTTLCLQSRCSSQLSYIPKLGRPEQI